MKVLEINDNDIYGKIFNGYEIMEKLNNQDNFSVKQLVINKYSSNKNCVTLFSNWNFIDHDVSLHKLEHDIMSTHSLLSASTLLLKNNNYYRDADLVHFHQVHNSRFSLPLFFEMAKTKPTIISFHDPWFLTGRCVHNLKCDKWKNGCKNCEQLDTIFDLPYDNCSELWKIKSNIQLTDIDIIVHSKYMYDMVKQNPYTKNLRVHEIPLGIDISKYNFNLSKEEAKRKLNIFPTDKVIFFREQRELKGTDYIVKALKKLKEKGGITLLTCSQTGLLKEIENDFNIIELGVINEEDMLLCYNASDLFLMPSLSESFGMMAIEAMAAGVPTIVFNNSALPSTTGAPDVGILVNNLDDNDLYEKIEYYLNNKDERLKRGKLSKEFVAKHYDYNTFFDNICDVYKRAYQKQKYKLKSNTKILNEHKIVDFDNSNVKKLVYKLNIIYDKSLNGIPKPSFLKHEGIKGNDIKYSDKNVINLINKFNDYIYNFYNSEQAIQKVFNNNKNLNVPSKNINNQPKVSIIIPVYNGSNYVSSAIDSALRQTYSNKEIIVVNDGSTDTTDKVCKSYGNLIKYIKKENGGVSTALNMGIKNMTGDYFSWLSHDDLYYPDKISTEIEYLKSKKLLYTKTILYSNFSLINEYGNLISDTLFDSNILNKDSAFSILKGGINGLTLLIPKKAFKDAGLFDKELRCVQDYKLWFDMYKQGYNFVHINNVLACTRIHQNSVTNTSPRVVTEGNEFWINTINSFSDKEKINLYGSIYNYYFELYNFFKASPYDKALKLCKEKCEKIENLKRKEIKGTLVSIIIPFYNNVRSTIRAINSALDQTYSNTEILLINNGSTEDLTEINKLAKKNNKIKIITLKIRKHISSVWNMGIKKSSGEYVVFLRYCDIINKEKVEKQLIKMLSSGNKISHTSYYIKNNNTSEFINSGYKNGNIISSIISECDINISTVMVNKNYILDSNYLFITDGKPAETERFLFQILKENKILGIQDALTIVNQSNNDVALDEKYKTIIDYILHNSYFDTFLVEKSKLLNYYIDKFLSSEKIGNDQAYFLERYKYLQTREFNTVSKVRRILNKVSFRKEKPTYLLEVNDLIYSRLTKMYRILRRLYIKIKR